MGLTFNRIVRSLMADRAETEGGARVNRLAVLALLALSLPAFADESQLPNATDLKAAYCVKVYQAQLGALNEMQQLAVQAGPAGQPLRDKVADDMRDRSANLRHVQAYLLPRLEYLDPVGLLAASKSAEADIEQGKELGAKCVQQCGADSDCALKCVPVESAVISRVRSCSDLSFLPF